MADTTTIRINKDVYKELKKIAGSENETMQKIMEKAIEEYRTRIYDTCTFKARGERIEQGKLCKNGRHQVYVNSKTD